MRSASLWSNACAEHHLSNDLEYDMSSVSTADIASDHKHWLLELERWEGYLRTWTKQQEGLTKETARLVREHGESLEQHARAVEGLRHDIAECERLFASGLSIEKAKERHLADAARHDEQRNLHERLKQSHHQMMAALASIKGQPCREE
jgi:hypothetical protein